MIRDHPAADADAAYCAPEHDRPWYACPACGQGAIYVRSLGRVMHTDGSTNQPCWVRILRGEISYEIGGEL